MKKSGAITVFIGIQLFNPQFEDLKAEKDAEILLTAHERDNLRKVVEDLETKQQGLRQSEVKMETQYDFMTQNLLQMLDEDVREIYPVNPNLIGFEQIGKIYESATMQMNILKEEKMALADDIVQLKTLIAAKENEIQSLSDQVSAESTQITVLQDRCKAQSKSFQRDLADMQKQSTIEISKLEETNKRLVDTIEKNNKEVSEYVIRLESTNGRKTQDIKQLKKKLERYKDLVATSTLEIKFLQEKLNQKDNENVQEIKELTEKFYRAKALLLSETIDHKKLQKKVDGRFAEMQKVERELKVERSHLVAVNSKVDNLKMDLDNSRRSYETLTARCHVVELENEELSNNLAEAKKQIYKMKKEKEEAARPNYMPFTPSSCGRHSGQESRK